jgi:hypothetical protein
VAPNLDQVLSRDLFGSNASHGRSFVLLASGVFIASLLRRQIPVLIQPLDENLFDHTGGGASVVLRRLLDRFFHCRRDANG